MFNIYLHPPLYTRRSSQKNVVKFRLKKLNLNNTINAYLQYNNNIGVLYRTINSIYTCHHFTKTYNITTYEPILFKNKLRSVGTFGYLLCNMLLYLYTYAVVQHSVGAFIQEIHFILRGRRIDTTSKIVI